VGKGRRAGLTARGGRDRLHGIAFVGPIGTAMGASLAFPRAPADRTPAVFATLLNAHQGAVCGIDWSKNGNADVRQDGERDSESPRAARALKGRNDLVFIFLV
jgi:hypothetical protein